MTSEHGVAPRVWPVFVAYLAALFTAVAGQIVVVVAVFVWHVANGASVQHVAEDLPALLTTPGVFMALTAVGQIVIALASIVPAVLSRVPLRSRLGLEKPTLPVWGHPFVVIGALVPFGIGLALAHALTSVIPPNPTVSKLYEQMTAPMAVPFIVFIALVPGFTEELFFRGYMQRRLLQRWSPSNAILASSALFAIMHLDPHHVVFALPLGIWFGVLAWRTRSVWPSMICHAFVNASWNVWQIGVRFAVLEEKPPILLLVTGGVIVLACFFTSLWLVAGTKVQTSDKTPPQPL